MYFDNVPTCGIVSLKFDINSWSELKEKSGRLHFYQYPKDFKDKD
jgi:phosphohistidine phosphatase